MDNINPLLKLGDHLIARRVGYTHHGLYLGDGNVLEYLMNEGVTIVPLSSFANGHEIFIREHKNARYQGIQAVNRGMLRLGENHYNLLTRNCEHFVNWCIEGIESSRQVDNLILTIIPFYSIFQKSDFLRGCLKVVFDDPNSLDQAFARINASKKSAYDPIERAKELSEDIFGSNKLNIVSIASLITTASQLSKEYAQWAKEKRHGSNNLLKSSLELSAQAIDNLNNKLGVSFYTQENQSTTDSPIYAGNNSKLQGIKDTLKLIKHVSDFLNLNKSEADPAPSATPEPNSTTNQVSLATSPAPSAHAALVAPAASKVAATASSVATAATAAATAVATASTSQDPHKAIKQASTLVKKVLNELNNQESLDKITHELSHSGLNFIKQAQAKIDEVLDSKNLVAQYFDHASDYFQRHINSPQTAPNKYYYEPGASCSVLSSKNHSNKAKESFNDLAPKSALPPSWENKLPKIHINLEPEVFANAMIACNQTNLESALARHALSAQSAQSLGSSNHTKPNATANATGNSLPNTYSLNNMAIDLIAEVKEELSKDLKNIKK